MCSLFLVHFQFLVSSAQCECAHTIRVGMVLVVRPYVHYIYIYSDKHTSARKAIQISPPNLSEGGYKSNQEGKHILAIPETI